MTRWDGVWPVGTSIGRKVACHCPSQRWPDSPMVLRTPCARAVPLPLPLLRRRVMAWHPHASTGAELIVTGGAPDGGALNGGAYVGGALDGGAVAETNRYATWLRVCWTTTEAAEDEAAEDEEETRKRTTKTATTTTQRTRTAELTRTM